MRASHKARANESPMDLQLGPLIDCVFLLLTYFIFTITLTTTEGLLPSQLAVGDESQQQEQPPPEEREIIVRMVQTGSRVQYFIDDWPVTAYEEVARQLGTLAKTSLVVIDAGPNVTYEHVIRLYNECLRLEITRVVFPLSAGALGGAGASGGADAASAPADGAAPEEAAPSGGWDVPAGPDRAPRS